MSNSGPDPHTLLVLGLETSHPPGSVALLRGQQLIEQSLPEQRSTASSLFVMIERLLSDWKCCSDDVALLAVTAGPGSFTGLRIGMTVAKVWSYVRNTPIVALPTMQVIAAQVPVELLELWILLDAQWRELFAQKFIATGGQWRPAGDCQMLPAARWWELLEGDCQVAGSGWKRAEGRGGAKERLVRLAPTVLSVPRAGTLARLARELWQTGHRADPWRLVPQYIRPSGAEEKHSLATEQE